mmetsp:Transcript_12042/g.22400  ORF Transcript_12042/g.22400 Transcript_12042/m.22400 type:complete len:142 (-) Transcript_12042:140-565(-)
MKCEVCEKEFCKECNEVIECERCEGDVCRECFYTCDWCNDTRCCGLHAQCNGVDCNKAHCKDCFNGEDRDVEHCDVCHKEFCSDCRYLACSKDWSNSCSGCVLAIARTSRNRKLQEENEKLSKEIETLRQENEMLKEIFEH